MVTAETQPSLRRGVRLTYDPVRGATVLLFPEGVLIPNETAAAVLAHCDGSSTVAGIVSTLAEAYPDVELEDVTELLGRLWSRRLIEVPDA